ncbi:MAG: PilZ domain-containing protein [Pseudomonadota bacterium]
MQEQHFLSSTVSKILANKRAAERVRSTFTASIHAEDLFYCHCIIRDVSNTGMKLEIQQEIDLPESFIVKTPAMTETLMVRLAWRKRKEIGVEFVSVQQEETEEQIAS